MRFVVVWHCLAVPLGGWIVAVDMKEPLEAVTIIDWGQYQDTWPAQSRSRKVADGWIRRKHVRILPVSVLGFVVTSSRL